MIAADGAEEIAAGIVRLLSDDSFRRELGHQARAFAEEFNNPRAWGARLETIYAEACRGPAPAQPIPGSHTRRDLYGSGPN